jgi:protein-tyrosine phosphatase
MMAAGDAMTVNNGGRYMMIELPHWTIPPRFEQWIFALKLKGITPIITHPERNLVIEENMDELYPWVKLGALVQITAMSVTGEFGGMIRDIAHRMLKDNLVHVIATDAHSVSRRPPILSRARDAAGKLIGGARADRLVHTNPSMILQGKPVDAALSMATKNSAS